MLKRRRVEYSQLAPGFELPPSSYKLDFAMVATYLKAIEETSDLYQGTTLVPPMAIAAYAMTALSERISIPPGTIHVSQEIEFIDTVSVGDTIICHAKVSRKQDRGRLHLLAIDLNVFKQNQKVVLAGTTSFVLPMPDEDGAL